MGTPIKDIVIPSSAPNTLMLQKHADYIAAYGEKKDDYEYVMTEFLRMNGMYWGLTSMALTGQLNRMDRSKVIDFVQKCQHECGGFSCSIGHDPHLLSTLSAIQILTLFDALDTVDTEAVVRWVKSLQQSDGCFYGDKWGEIDTRFSFCAVACLALLNRLHEIDVDKAVDFVVSCMNFDGAFGCRPGSESHSGQVYCCVGMLSVTGRLHHVNADQLGWWLCERQLPSGGLNGGPFVANTINIIEHATKGVKTWRATDMKKSLPMEQYALLFYGRPEKLPDVCYSWWVLASLKIIGRLHWIDKDKLVQFILACQDEETGGFADRPGDMVDPFHTLFGLAGLSLLGDTSVKPVNPVLCMPEDVIRKTGVQLQYL